MPEWYKRLLGGFCSDLFTIIMSVFMILNRRRGNWKGRMRMAKMKVGEIG
jgi:hypothetical protein